MRSKKKKKTKLVVIGVILLVLVIGATVLVNFLPMLSMHPIETGYVEDTPIIAIKNQKNDLFLMDTNDGYILIDAGSNVNAIIESLNEQSIDPDEVKYIFLTHTDYDHVASLSLFSNAQILLSANEMQMIDGTTKRSAFSGNSLQDGIEIGSLTPLNNGDQMEIGGCTVECIDAPGHTPGSMAYLINDKYLFTGDAFKVSKGVISTHPYSMDKALSKGTINDLETYFKGSELVLTAHYGYFYPDKLSK